MIKLSCLCGQLRVETAQRPDFVNECNCTLCSKTGAQWGYFHPIEVHVAGVSQGFSRADKDVTNAEIRFCPTCGTTTHYVLTESAIAQHGNVVMGVNMRLADTADLAGVELRFPDGRAWDGASPFGYVRDAVVIGG